MTKFLAIGLALIACFAKASSSTGSTRAPSNSSSDLSPADDAGALALMSCPEQEEGKIPLLRPHPTNCRILVACDAAGNPTLLYCPRGQVFSARHQECKKKTECEKDVADPLTMFSPCPAEIGDELVLQPHPTECEMFYMCDNGGFAHLRECPSKLHFNPVKKVCDWPHSAGCKASFFMKMP